MSCLGAFQANLSHLETWKWATLLDYLDTKYWQLYNTHASLTNTRFLATHTHTYKHHDERNSKFRHPPQLICWLLAAARIIIVTNDSSVQLVKGLSSMQRKSLLLPFGIDISILILHRVYCWALIQEIDTKFMTGTQDLTTEKKRNSTYNNYYFKNNVHE